MSDETWLDTKNKDAYLFRMAVNAAFQVWKKNGREEATDASDPVWDIVQNPTDVLEEIYLREIIERNFSQEEQLLLKLIEAGYTSKEIAEMLGLREATVRQRIRRLREKLLRLLQENDSLFQEIYPP